MVERNVVERLTETLRAELGQSLHSVCLFGSGRTASGRLETPTREQR